MSTGFYVQRQAIVKAHVCADGAHVVENEVGAQRFTAERFNALFVRVPDEVAAAAEQFPKELSPPATPAQKT